MMYSQPFLVEHQQQQQQQQHQDPTQQALYSEGTASSPTMTSFELTSTTAPGVVFSNRAELAEHYRSDWHKYNLKRREAGLPMLYRQDFLIRLHAAQAVRAAAEQQSQRSGTSHLKDANNNSNHPRNSSKRKTHNNKFKKEKGNTGVVSMVPAFDQMKREQQNQQQVQQSTEFVGHTEVASISLEDKQKNEQMNNCMGKNVSFESISTTCTTTKIGPTAHADSEVQPNNSIPISLTVVDEVENEVNNMDEDPGEPVVIDPRQSLFDRTVCKTVDINAKRMYKKYGFFIPDREYLVDLEGLIGFCHEKITFGHICLYCHRTFRSGSACKAHMVDKGHTKLKYEAGYDLEELSVFYNFDLVNKEFLHQLDNRNHRQSNQDARRLLHQSNANKNNGGDDNDEEWEDASEDGSEANIITDMDEEDNGDDNNDDDDELYDGYQDEIEKMGFDVTALGELVFPDGRIVGHRALRRYYQQKPRHSTNNDSTAVVAARIGARERLYRGCVYSLPGTGSVNDGSSRSMVNLDNNKTRNSKLLSQVGIVAPGSITGRVGRGILTLNPGGTTYNQLSVYRYRAVVRKQRRDDHKGKRIYEKQYLNMNHMDKRHNNKMNGVSVAHALR